MEHILFGIIMVLFLIALGVMLIHAIVGENSGVWVSRGILFILVVIAFAIEHKEQIEGRTQPPCVKEEIRHVLVNKVLTPYKVCLERGEWVK